MVCNITRNRLYVNGHTTNYKGEITITVRDIENPTNSGLSENLYVRTYDGQNKKIIEKSFKNLDPFSFDYSYPGPLIIVNNNQDVVMYKGTQSIDL